MPGLNPSHDQANGPRAAGEEAEGNPGFGACRSGTLNVGTQTHGKRRFIHHIYAPRTGRNTAAATRRATPEFLADLYRH